VIKTISTLFISMNCLAGFSELDSSKMYDYQFDKPTKRIERKRVYKRRAVKRINNQALLNKLLKKDIEISKILERSQRKLIVRKKAETIRSFSRFKAVLLESIIATNRKPTSFLVRFKPNDSFLGEAEVQCSGMSFNKRVTNKCQLLVSEEGEYEVNVVVKDLDGAEGIIADSYYTGEEGNFLTSSLSSFFSGVMDATKDKILTPFGESTKINAKNKVLGGLMNVAQQANSKIAESKDRNLNISFVNSGKEVIVFFNRGIKLKQKDNI